MQDVIAWADFLRTGLSEDEWQWDWTTLGSMKSADQMIRARVIAKSDGIWAATGLVEAMGDLATTKLEDGDVLKKGAVVCEWAGPARYVLAYERPFLNVASYVCGIATRTRKLVHLVEEACPNRTPRVTSTRKTLPGYRNLALHGVLCGGGHLHRTTLSGGVLIKENHISTAGSIRAAVEGARAIAPHTLKIEVEVRNEKELLEAVEADAEIVMLDNFTPTQVRAALKKLGRDRPVIEVSGGLNEDNIADYAIEGVDILSVGSLTHSVRALDLSLLVK